MALFGSPGYFNGFLAVAHLHSVYNQIIQVMKGLPHQVKGEVMIAMG
jgi:hypothetical protein